MISKLYGICTKIENNKVYVANRGIYDINVEGIICLGDKITTSETPGKGVALKYEELEEDQFDIRSIGKIIKLYADYNRAQILLDIE